MAFTPEYQNAINAFTNFYNVDADAAWTIINQNNITPDKLYELLPTTDSFLYGQGVNTGYTAVKAADGSVLSWANVGQSAVNSASAAQQALDSNTGLVTQQQFQLPANTDFSGAGGTLNGTKGITGGASGALHVMSQVSAATAAAGLGIKLGKTIDSALYNINPDFWDNAGLSSLNPETWNSITADMSDTGWEGTLKRAFNAVFGINPQTGETQMYIDEEAAAYLAQYMQENGVFAPNTAQVINKPESFPDISPATLPLVLTTSEGTFITYNTNTQTYGTTVKVVNIYTNNCISFTTGNALISVQYSTTAESGLNRSYNFNNQIVYYAIGYTTLARNITIPDPACNQQFPFSYTDYTHYGYLAWLACYNYISGGGIDGVSNQDGATQPDFSNCTTADDYKRELQRQYPSMYDGAITQNVAQPDGSVKTRRYVPVGTPSAPSNQGTQNTQPTTNENQSGQSQTNTVVNPENTPDSLIDTIVGYITNLRTPDTPSTPNPPDTGSGNTPPVVPPTGQASSLFAVYNPTQSALNSFGAWLWSSNFIDQLLKLFNDPMQSIIGLHKIFASPNISGAANIRVGYLDSGVSANTVGNQYTTINCGTVSVREQFGNVFDYNDTDVRLYLPFIGIVPLDVMDVMRGSVSVIYHVDVITGACLAEVKVTRDGGGGTLYQFAGDAAVRYPISSGSYMGVVSGVLGVVGGIASGIMSGGATLPMAAGAIAGGVGNAKTTVQHSGSFAGNAGAMGAKKPYLIIERPQGAIADGYRPYQGRGANSISNVGDMTGYFKMTDVRTNSVTGAAESEIDAIRAALEQGVIK